MFKWGVTMPITNYIVDKSGRKYEFGIRNADSQSSEVAQASDALNDAYRRYNHAEGYNNVKAAIYDISAAELRLSEAVERAKKTKQEAST